MYTGIYLNSIINYITPVNKRKVKNKKIGLLVSHFATLRVDGTRN